MRENTGDRKSEKLNRLTQALSKGEVAWWEMDVATGRVTYGINKTRMLGVDQSGFNHYSDFTGLLHEDDYPGVMKAMRDVIIGKKEIYSVAYRIRRKDSSWIWFKDIGSVTERSAEGKPAVISGVVINITASRENEEKYEFLFENSRDAICIHDHDGNIIDVNPQACRNFGYSKSEMLSMNISRILKSKDRGLVELIVQRLEETNTVDFETVTEDATGRKSYFEISSRKMSLDTREFIVSTIKNISQRKYYQRELNYRYKLEKVINEIASKLIKSSKEPVFQEIKNSFEMISHYIPLEMITLYMYGDDEEFLEKAVSWKKEKTVLDGRIRIEREALPEIIKTLGESNEVTQLPDEEFHALFGQKTAGIIKSSVLIPIYTDNRLFGFIGFFSSDENILLKHEERNVLRVISGMISSMIKQKHEEDELEETKNRYKAVFENSGTGMGIIRKDTTLEMVNTRFVKMSGYEKSELENSMSWTSFVAPADLEKMKQFHFRRRERKKGAPSNYEFTMIDKWGKEMRILLNVKMIPGTEKSIVSLIDITKRKDAEKDLQKKTNQLETLISSMPDTLVVVDHEGIILEVNNRGVETQLFKDAFETGNRIQDALVGDEKETFLKALQKTLKTGKLQAVGFWLKSSSKKKQYIEFRIKQIENDKAIVIIRNRTGEKKEEEKIKYLSFHDQLTGLYNRRFFEKEMSRMEHSRQLPITLFVADLNGLKHVNDTQGHKEGDKVIIRAANFLKETLRSEDILSRIGGDEFAALLPNTNAEAAERIKERILNAIRRYNEDRGTGCSMAVGYSVKEEKTSKLEEVFREADSNMYEDKRKNALHYHS